MIQFSTNLRYIQFIILLSMLFCLKVKAQQYKNEVVKIKMTSTTSNTLSVSENKFITKLAIDKFRFSYVNVFNNNKETDQKQRFYMNDYKRSFLIFSHDTIIIKGFSGIACANANRFPVLYAGDSIDNEQGFYAREIKFNNHSYFILSGYSLGCNGRFCQSLGILIIDFFENKISHVYQFGADAAVIDIAWLRYKVIGNSLSLYLNSHNSKKIELKVKSNGLYLDKNVLNSAGIFCTN